VVRNIAIASYGNPIYELQEEKNGRLNKTTILKIKRIIKFRI